MLTQLTAHHLPPGWPAALPPILLALSRLSLIPADDSHPPRILIPSQIQQHLIDLLDIDVTWPRWLTW
ncbi:hypothetical protein [Nonomuraea sp. NEAU-A123]|uniref:hypothetical protein n=1 Tax=Nonomuraea sp. NEAU-A123 TaxID=2839649 RepID=UPI001BE4A627|nr:hypothetical protein [Nonomuraea sp. NEAU-A123]MBT2229527.1 hypothetical protein [Nonomuraea sp. NEAU-A123]